MGGFIVGVGIAVVIIIIVKLGSNLSNKRKQKKQDSSVIEIKENTTDKNEVEKGA